MDNGAMPIAATLSVVLLAFKVSPSFPGSSPRHVRRVPPKQAAKRGDVCVASNFYMDDEVARQNVPISIPIPFPRFPLISSLPAPRLTADMDKMDVVVW
jgi:hypothetical protein